MFPDSQSEFKSSDQAATSRGTLAYKPPACSLNKLMMNKTTYGVGACYPGSDTGTTMPRFNLAADGVWPCGPATGCTKGWTRTRDSGVLVPSILREQHLCMWLTRTDWVSGLLMTRKTRTVSRIIIVYCARQVKLVQPRGLRRSCLVVMTVDSRPMTSHNSDTCTMNMRAVEV